MSMLETLALYAEEMSRKHDALVEIAYTLDLSLEQCRELARQALGDTGGPDEEIQTVQE